jgi:hypothetical protein
MLLSEEIFALIFHPCRQQSPQQVEKPKQILIRDNLNKARMHKQAYFNY